MHFVMVFMAVRFHAAGGLQMSGTSSPPAGYGAI